MELILMAIVQLLDNASFIRNVDLGQGPTSIRDGEVVINMLAPQYPLVLRIIKAPLPFHFAVGVGCPFLFSPGATATACTTTPSSLKWGL